MLITKLGHSCLRVQDGDADVLVDPGTFSSGFTELTGLTAVLVTHQHADHLDLERLPALLAANPAATVHADPGSAAQLHDAGIPVQTVRTGDSFDVGTPVTVHGGEHAVIHRDVPTVPNAMFLIGGRLLHPGDALVVPDVPVDILGVPAAAPWMALKEAVEFYRSVQPRKAFPIHERLLVNPAMAFGLLERLGPADADWLEPADGEPFEL